METAGTHRKCQCAKHDSVEARRKRYRRRKPPPTPHPSPISHSSLLEARLFLLALPLPPSLCLPTTHTALQYRELPLRQACSLRHGSPVLRTPQRYPRLLPAVKLAKRITVRSGGFYGITRRTHSPCRNRSSTPLACVPEEAPSGLSLSRDQTTKAPR
ncbi:hypothetical protein K431DRAFT_29382 [Polychaeton citri CBS 116435]|uniref:Uncharacterized protein n=1 Tax=Polychaeton citri CBS 116435 TaxID=1314669 RepID=A0A9P4PW94_9PEZI|nr:hypothetical protein K431DRAFT_29382 [Polychaeton citri CBS 116435]